jgi:outer membrane lipopolysaccharide assembly protein LptE/RlpB
VIDRVRIENADELKKIVRDVCATVNDAIIVYMGNAFKDRFLFDQGYDPIAPGVELVEGIIYQDASRYGEGFRLPKDLNVDELSQTWLQQRKQNLFQNPALILRENHDIICRVFGRDETEFQKTQHYLYHRSNLKQLQLLRSTLMGRIGAISNVVHRIDPQQRQPQQIDKTVAEKIKSFQAAYPQGIQSEKDMENVLLSQLQEHEEELRKGIRTSVERQYRENPKLFCENIAKFDIEELIKNMRIQGGWIPSDKPQPLRSMDVVQRFHLRLYKEECEKLCRQG